VKGLPIRWKSGRRRECHRASRGGLPDSHRRSRRAPGRFARAAGRRNSFPSGQAVIPGRCSRRARRSRAARSRAEFPPRPIRVDSSCPRPPIPPRSSRETTIPFCHYSYRATCRQQKNPFTKRFLTSKRELLPSAILLQDIGDDGAFDEAQFVRQVSLVIVQSSTRNLEKTFNQSTNQSTGFFVKNPRSVNQSTNQSTGFIVKSFKWFNKSINQSINQLLL
jgi:hypothetical protein